MMQKTAATSGSGTCKKTARGSPADLPCGGCDVIDRFMGGVHTKVSQGMHQPFVA